ncbi:hypothetical protein ACLBKU_10205 [Erythrobacter sp. NE805]|uniref:hypothetical protein n=1 Tax=Erythrobacter sp. NE805 TaxID=3389875 RepID=UPI00396B40C3
MAKRQPATPPDPKAIDWRRKDAYRKDFARHANLAFLIKSFGIGVIALAVPIVLPLVGGYSGHYSISYFYHVPETRDLFVGLLWALGLFLVLFQGLSRAENLLLTLAGVLLICVAMVPTGIAQCTDTAFDWHEGFAFAFFACLFVVALGFSKRRLTYILWPPLRARFARAYTFAGVLMIALPLAAWGIAQWQGPDCGHAVYWTEGAAILAFAFYWFVKTIEYKRLLGLSLKVIWRRLVG